MSGFDDEPVFEKIVCCCRRHAGANKCPNCPTHNPKAMK